MPFDSQAFLADVLSKVDADKRGAIEEAFGHAAVTTALDAGYLRQDDYSRRQDELKTARDDAAATLNQDRGALAAERARLADWYEGASKDYAAKNEENKRYRTEYGGLEGEGTPPAAEPGLTREEHDRLMNESLDIHSRQSIQFADLLTDLKMEHRDQFSERLDTKALFDHQSKTKMPLDVAYKDFISERVGEAQAEKQAQLVAAAKAEGILEGKSQRDLPVRPDNNPVMRALDKPNDRGETGGEAAAAAWRQAQSA